MHKQRMEPHYPSSSWCPKSNDKKPSCCWVSRWYLSLVQASLLYGVRYSHKKGKGEHLL